jgi:hypothetical protein
MGLWGKAYRDVERALKNGEREERLAAIEKRLMMLECLHAKVEFAESWDIFWPRFSKTCLSCGKVLANYDTWQEFETARIAYEEAKLATDKKVLSAVLAKQPKGKKK